MKAPLGLGILAIACSACSDDAEEGYRPASDTQSEMPTDLLADDPHALPEIVPLPQPRFVVELARPHVVKPTQEFVRAWKQGYNNPDAERMPEDSPAASGFNTGQNSRRCFFEFPGEGEFSSAVASHFTQEFVEEFFEGFVYPTQIRTEIDELSRAGFEAGRRHRLEHPEQLRATFVSFGYVFRELQGIWSLGHSHTGFETTNQRDDERWWFHPLQDSHPEFPDEIPDGRYPVIVKGFLSPKGCYGHQGWYSHQFFATEVRKTNHEGEQTTEAD